MIQPEDVVKHKGYSLLFKEMYFSSKPRFWGALTEALTYMPKAGDMPPKLSFQLSELEKVLRVPGCLNKAPFLKDWCLSPLLKGIPLAACCFYTAVHSPVLPWNSSPLTWAAQLCAGTRPPEEYEKTGKREDLLLLRCCSLTGRGLLPARRSHRSLCAGAAKRKNTGKVFVREPTTCPSAQNRKKQRCNHGFKPKKKKTSKQNKKAEKVWV